jgi:hypothetical protein
LFCLCNSCFSIEHPLDSADGYNLSSYTRHSLWLA